ncbi:MAG: hypothetical protein FWC77_04595 [Defluviitaleaceae bacterium]|nr:hypothetical protein [Defluviitaleaceae bacterium]
MHSNKNTCERSKLQSTSDGVSAPSKILQIPTPQICLFDFDDDVVTKLAEHGFNVRPCSLGKVVHVPDNSYCLLNHEWPNNLHEYDIFMIDMKDREAISYNKYEHIRQHNSGDKVHYFFVRSPQNVFDPRAAAGESFREYISITKKQIHIIVVFASAENRIPYELRKQTSTENAIVSSPTISNYSFLSHRHINKNINGSKINIVEGRSDFRSLLTKHKELFSYEVIFTHPYAHDSSGYRSALAGLDKTFFPLMTNANDEIVSYAERQDNCLVIVLPQMEPKYEVVVPLLKEILPDILPELFPESTRFAWKSEADYWLPNHENLLINKTKIEEEYAEKLKCAEDEITKNLKEYSFLHDMLTGTDDNLVDAVITYLRWLGFNSVKKMDDDKALKEEDIQVELDDGLLVIEVKGIGGTSKDEDCSQIYKIKNRRCEERKCFDVSALYIVNHQRHMPPKQRRNPPFTPEQVKDANTDKRGLLTTWELYRTYFWICSGIATKEDTRKKLLCSGSISLMPDMDLIGQSKDIYKNGKVHTLELNGMEIKKEDCMIAEADGQLQRVKVQSIQINDNDVDEAFSGEVGIQIDKAIKSKVKFYKLVVKPS